MYNGPEYFCDRKDELKELKSYLRNGHNVVLSAPRRIGKSGLIHRLFDEKDIQDEFNCIYVDVFATKSLKEFALTLVTQYLEQSSKPVHHLARYAASFLKAIRLDPADPNNISIGDIKSPEVTVEQMFRYLRELRKPTVLAIDEFQQVASYQDASAEAFLRTQVQQSPNIRMIFAGSEQSLLSEIFSSYKRPFAMSSTFFELSPLNREVYCRFAQEKFEIHGRHLPQEVFFKLYDDMEGTTWFVQDVLNFLFTNSGPGQTLNREELKRTLERIIKNNEKTYIRQSDALHQSEFELLGAIAREKVAENIRSNEFLEKYGLSAKSVAADEAKLIKEKLVWKDCPAVGIRQWRLCDYFMAEWLRRSFSNVSGV